MSVAPFELPDDPRALCKVIDQHATREEVRLSFRRTMWLFAWYYLNGARRFDRFNPESGLIVPAYLDTEGNLEFICQELLTAINRTSGRLASLDLSPKVFRGDFSLPGLRDKASAQIIADSIIRPNQLEEVKTVFSHLYTCLGSAGITGHIVDHPTIGLTADLEAIHPKELLPFPSVGQDYTKINGLVRSRVVPLPYLERRFGKAKVASMLEDIEWWEVQTGSSIERLGTDLPTALVYTDSRKDTRGKQPTTNQDTSAVALVRELWIDGPAGTCAQYACVSGQAVFTNEKFKDQEVYCPIGFARFYETGTFHGAGLFDVLFGITREQERCLKSLFNNIRDTDRYGFVVMPSGSWNERAALREVGRGLRVLPYEPDPMADGFRPFAVQPFNLGDIPGKTAAFAGELVDRINPWRDLLREKGRVDSANGLQFLDEQVNQAITNPTRGIGHAFGRMYRAAVGRARSDILLSPRPIPVNRITLDLAGAVIDPVENTVDFTTNPVPNLSRLTFGVREQNLHSPLARKQEAIELVKMGMSDPISFILYSLENGIDVAMYMSEFSGAYETVVRNLLLAYGDGQTPGQVIITPHNSKPEFQLRVVDGFLNDPRFGLASVDVQTALINYRTTLLQWTGAVLPENVPNPDDAAIMQSIEQNAINGGLLPGMLMQPGGPAPQATPPAPPPAGGSSGGGAPPARK